MPYLKGVATDFDDLIRQVVDWCTDSAIHGDDAWTLMRSEPWPKGTILQAHGFERGEKQYIGIMPVTFIKGQTYAQWFFQHDVFEKEFLYGANGLQCAPGTRYQEGTFAMNPKDNSDYYYFYGTPDVMENSCQAMFFGVFKQYCDALNWDEQAGNDRPALKCRPIKYRHSESKANSPSFFQAPTFPGLGHPAIGCDVDGFVSGYAEFWVIKDRNHLKIVLKNGKYWEIGYAGFIDPYHRPTEYSFPAALIGGTSGVIPTIDFVNYGTTCPTIEVGFRFDFSPKNWLLSHANPLSAGVYSDWTSTWDDDYSISQVQLLSPTSLWRSYANFAIGKEVLTWPTCSGCPIYYTGFRLPNQQAGLRHIIRPTCSALGGTTHIYDPSSESVKYQLEPVELVEINSHGVTNIYGKFRGIFWPSSPIYRYGELTMSGKKCLVIPNSWERRPFHIHHGLTMKFDAEDLRKINENLEEQSSYLNCVIRLED